MTVEDAEVPFEIIRERLLGERDMKGYDMLDAMRTEENTAIHSSTIQLQGAMTEKHFHKEIERLRRDSDTTHVDKVVLENLELTVSNYLNSEGQSR